jgi:uncharacterized protein (TIGR00297 family)
MKGQSEAMPSRSLSPAEWRRKGVHAGIGLLALTLRWLDWRAAAAVALAALLFNWFVLPRIGRGLYRDPSRTRDIGIVAYPAMVLLLVLLFRDRYLSVAAAVWAMMAFGDPAAAVAGSLLGGPRLPWNPWKTWAGTLSDWAVGGLGAVLVFRFVTARPLVPAAASVLVAGAALYAFLESIPSGVDDNLVAAVPTALAVFQLGYQWGDHASGWPGLTATAILAAAALNAAVALATWSLRVVSTTGALAGAVAGFVIIVSGGWGAYAVLWTFFLAGTLATRWGYRRKEAQGMAQADSGRRGAPHVLANVGVPAALLVLGVRPVAFAAALAAALADTLGTEIGGLYGDRPISLLKLSRLPVGAAGAVSFAGVAAGAVGAVVVGAVGFLTGLVSAPAISVIAAAGVGGSLAESLVRDLAREAGVRLDHDFANALNTLTGALIALEITLSIEGHALFVPVVGG